jgi:alpha-L-rhamnosidase
MTDVMAKTADAAATAEVWRIRRAETLATENAQFVSEGRALADVAAIEDYGVPVAGGDITVRAYSPHADGPQPAVVHFHGGGFTLFSIDWLVSIDWCRDICARTGAIVLDVDYRLAPEHPFPTAPEDCYRAFEWVAERADALGIDRGRIALAGESAGATLAVAVALMARDNKGPSAAGLILEIPAGDLATGHRHRSAFDFAEGFGLTRLETVDFHSAYLPNTADSRHPYASPVHAHLEGLPPTQVMTAELDVVRDSGELLARRLRDAGVPTSLRRHRGHRHGSANRDRRWLPARAWRDEVVAGIEGLFARVAPVDVRVEHSTDPFGIGVATPRISWRVESSKPNWIQTAYEIEVAGEAFLVESAESVLVPWPAKPLSSRERLELRIRVRDHDGEWSVWSAWCGIEAGLLDPPDWQADLITPDWNEDPSQDQPAPFMRREFVLDRPVAKARLYATAHGVYEPYLNGHAIGDDVLAPGWTSYTHRLRYQAYDVTEYLIVGRNALGVIVGDGWFRGRLGFREQRNLYGRRLALLAQLEIEYEDGTKQLVTTDDAWRATTGPILASSLYDGEEFDARRDLNGWAVAGYDDGSWRGVTIDELGAVSLVAADGPPVRRTELVEPVRILTSPSGKTIVDFGQNLVGRLRITVRGEAGQVITIRHAEVLEDGELCVRPLRYAAATDTYTLAGDREETWEPRFTFHGFRYAEIEGWPDELRLDDVLAVVLHSDLERTGWFGCSDETVGRLHENILWSMRGNFLDVPTDCPQRDERLGWTGDIQVFAPTAFFLYDTAGFLRSWLADLVAEQEARAGRVPNVVPDVLPAKGPADKHDWHAPAAGWGDAAVVVPWVFYERTGDAKILETQFESMCRWVDYVAALAGEDRIWDTGFQFGDWLDPAAPADHPNHGLTDPSLVATAYLARSAELTARAAQVLDRLKEQERYQLLADEVKLAFVNAYVRPDGGLSSDSQTAYALALEFDLVPDSARREFAAGRLEELVRENRYNIGTGFLGTPIITDALSNRGQVDTAYRLLLERSCPSWLYAVTMGATTIWERWDSLLPDGRVNAGEMTSFNHYAFGAIADWLHRTVAGLVPLKPGYRHFAIRPVPGVGLTSAWARHRTPYGVAEVSWNIDGRKLHVEAVVPPNTTAEVVLPGEPGLRRIGSGSHRWSVAIPPPG